MKLFKYILYLTVFLYTLSACKTARVAQKKDSAALSVDSLATDLKTPVKDTFYITSENDTLSRLDSVVEIGIHRLLKDTVMIAGVGDIMLGTNFPKESYLPPDSGRYLLKEVTPHLLQADVAFGNLEGVILNEGGDQKNCKNPDLCYLFRSPDHLAGNLKNAGLDVLSMANNHAGDFGDPGRKNTMKVLDSLEIYHAGLQTNPFTTFVLDGMKYGFAAFAPNSGTVSIHDLTNAKNTIKHLDSISDIVIVSFHGGAEGKKYQHVTRETETFYGENRGNVYQFSHELIDAGADVIFGHGPHVVRAVEVYKNRFIAYSLGNFCTYARFNLSGVNGFAPLVKVYTNSTGEFMFGKILPFKQISPGGPVYDENKSVIKKIRELTTIDFPESIIDIDEDGKIMYITQ